MHILNRRRAQKMLLCERLMICCFLLLTVGRLTGGISAYIGNTVKLFLNTEVDNNQKEVTLYVNGNRNYTSIATWRWLNGIIEVVDMDHDYEGRLKMDRDRNIWIKVDVDDAGKYCIKCDGYTKGVEVQLQLLGNLADEIGKITKEQNDQSELNKKYFGNLADEIGKITKEQNDQSELNKKYFGNLADEIGKITKEQNDQSELNKKYFVILMVAVLLLVLLVSCKKVLKKAFSRCRKCGGQQKGKQETDRPDVENFKMIQHDDAGVRQGRN